MTTNANPIFGVADSWGDKLEVRVPPTGDGLAIHTEHRSGTTSGGVFLTWGELQQLVRAIQGRIDMKVLDDARQRAARTCRSCGHPGHDDRSRQGMACHAYLEDLTAAGRLGLREIPQCGCTALADDAPGPKVWRLLYDGEQAEGAEDVLFASRAAAAAERDRLLAAGEQADVVVVRAHVRAGEQR
jgi:hypothetical protein